MRARLSMVPRFLCLCGILALAAFPASLAAQIVITEIMYDLEGSDSGREWIEVRNEGGESVDLTAWKLFEADTNHGIAAESGAMILPGSYAIIADTPDAFRADWPAYAGLLFNSVFSLSNTGETLAMRCCGKDLSDRGIVTYTSAAGGGDGLSLHRDGSAWVAASPSPGSGDIVRVSPQPVARAQARDASSPKAAVQGSNPDAEATRGESDVPADNDEDAHAEAVSISAAPAAGAAAVSKSHGWIWWATAIAVTLAGAGAAHYVWHLQRREWDIEEIQ